MASGCKGAPYGVLSPSHPLPCMIYSRFREQARAGVGAPVGEQEAAGNIWLPSALRGRPSAPLSQAGGLRGEPSPAAQRLAPGFALLPAGLLQPEASRPLT